jgi:hypothetical protein
MLRDTVGVELIGTAGADLPAAAVTPPGHRGAPS